MNSVKCYKSFIGFWPRMILYLIFPIVVAVLTYIQLGVFKHDWMISVVLSYDVFDAGACSFIGSMVNRSDLFEKGTG